MSPDSEAQGSTLRVLCAAIRACLQLAGTCESSSLFSVLSALYDSIEGYRTPTSMAMNLVGHHPIIFAICGTAHVSAQASHVRAFSAAFLQLCARAPCTATPCMLLCDQPARLPARTTAGGAPITAACSCFTRSDLKFSRRAPPARASRPRPRAPSRAHGDAQRCSGASPPGPAPCALPHAARLPTRLARLKRPPRWARSAEHAARRSRGSGRSRAGSTAGTQRAASGARRRRRGAPSPATPLPQQLRGPVCP